MTYSVRQMMESALRRAGIPPAKWSSEVTEIVRDQIGTMFDEMANLGMQLWARDQVILPLYQNVNMVPTPDDTSVVLTVNQRSLSRPDVVSPFTSAGGTAAFAFDDNFATACIQTATNGNIGALYSSPTQITTIGILFFATFTGTINYEYSLDSGSTWIAATSQVITAAAAGSWNWLDIEGTPQATGWRVRASGSSTNLAVDELYFGNNPTEIPMGVWNLDSWNAMVVKDTPGPPWNWYQQRDLTSPVLYVWPMPNDQAKYYQLVAWRRRYIEPITTLTQEMDISRRWNEALTCSLARRLCREVPEADMSRYPMLSGEESSAMSLAAGEERDPAPMIYNPGLEVYRA